MSAQTKSTNLAFATLVAHEIIAIVLFYNTDESGLAATMATVFTFCTLLAWGIIYLISRKAAKQPARVLTPEEMARYNVTRVLVALGLLAMIVFAVTSD